ncbi:hypothetical protein ACIRD3_18775 [Kitasatospora sp. NPDC093550]|uniref:hypothetical protein n=1 Tax=Kitasatospora sp. NPDC093550 TaxID=3364089 RepID=UPI0038255D9A
MTRRPPALRAALLALTLAGAALLTACGGPTDHPAPGTADSSQVQDLQHKLDAADTAATQADTDSATDDN